jgi:hypothetical protein
MNGRYEVLDADAEVTRHLDADVVVEAFRAWLNLTPNRVMSEALAWDSHAELWNAFGLEYRHLGFGQLTVVAHHVLALPASEARAERLNKILRRICRKAGSRLRPRQKLARLTVTAACFCDSTALPGRQILAPVLARGQPVLALLVCFIFTERHTSLDLFAIHALHPRVLDEPYLLVRDREEEPARGN